MLKSTTVSAKIIPPERCHPSLPSLTDNCTLVARDTRGRGWDCLRHHSKRQSVRTSLATSLTIVLIMDRHQLKVCGFVNANPVVTSKIVSE